MIGKTGQYIAIYYLQFSHNCEVEKYNKSNKGTTDFILRQKKVIYEGICYCTSVKNKGSNHDDMLENVLYQRKLVIH